MTDDKRIGAVLEIFQTERKREVIETVEEGRDGVDISASATDQDEIMVDVGQPQTPVDIAVDKAFKILVRNATEEFGFAPRDVYNAILDLPATRDLHAAAVKTSIIPN